MYKIIVCVLIYLLSMTLPVVSSAEALKKYSVPQQKSGPTVQPGVKMRPGYVSEDVYDRFKLEIQGYSQEEKDKLVNHFRYQLKKARRERNKEAEAHYQRLIGIIRAND